MRQRLKNAGLLEEDTMENTELVVQILRANEGMDVEALRTFQLFRCVGGPARAEERASK